jgi:hypothetical protein
MSRLALEGPGAGFKKWLPKRLLVVGARCGGNEAVGGRRWRTEAVGAELGVIPKGRGWPLPLQAHACLWEHRMPGSRRVLGQAVEKAATWPQQTYCKYLKICS